MNLYLKDIRNWPQKAGIYFAQAGTSDKVKIGMSRNIKNRLVSLQESADISGADYKVRLLAILPGSRREEQRLHDHFRSMRIWKNREWFRIRGALLTFLKTGKMNKKENLHGLNKTWIKLFDGSLNRYPFSVRFNANELDVIGRSAIKSGMKLTAWIREAVISADNSTICGLATEPAVRYGSAKTVGIRHVVPIRFSPVEMKRIMPSVAKSGLEVTTFVRVCAVKVALIDNGMFSTTLGRV